MALLMNGRKTATATAAGRVREFMSGWGPRPAFALLMNGRKTATAAAAETGAMGKGCRPRTALTPWIVVRKF